MMNAVENLAKAYIEIRKEGLIQFDDMLVIVHCSPQDTVGIEIKLQSIHQVIRGLRKEGKRSSLEFCQDLSTYLNNCVSKWRESMDRYRRSVNVRHSKT